MHHTSSTLLSDGVQAVETLVEILHDAEWMPVEQLNSFVTQGIVLVHQMQEYDIASFTDDEIHLINECADVLNHHTRQMFEGVEEYDETDE
tara:strand:- start:169 stop:441 length:273 start_codon:yes stop_codon:yes gene_type:complete